MGMFTIRFQFLELIYCCSSYEKHTINIDLKNTLHYYVLNTIHFMSSIDENNDNFLYMLVRQKTL